MGFVRTIVRRQVASHIDKAIQTRREQLDLDASAGVVDPHGNPEEAAIFHQKGDLIRKVLSELTSRDREILTRFYLEEETQEEICTEMTLTETQFRLLKSRAKSRFGELGKKRLAQGTLSAICMRTSAGSSH
jgi:RNA polymerase sigma factor (sigma-70 family)